MTETESQLKRYQTLINNVRDGIHVMDIQGNIVEVNDAFCDMLGYTQEQARKLNVADWNSQWSKEELLAIFKNLVGKKARFETMHRRKDGTLINVEVSTNGVTIEGQTYFFASSRDITERKHLEHGLRLLQYSVDHAQDAIFRLNQKAEIVYVNDAACKHLGYSQDELLKLSLFDINADFSPERWAVHWENIVNTGAKRFETHQKRKDGTLVPVEVVANCIEIDGEFIFTSFVRDITERNQTEEILRLTQFVTDQAPDCIIWVDEKARIVYANEAACREYGYTNEAMLSLFIPGIDPGTRIDRWPDHWQMLRQKGHLTIETTHQRKDGSIFPVEISANFISFENKEYNVAFMRDSTERKRAEEEIHNLAFYDSLTKLPNRRLLLDRLNLALSVSARNHQYGALLFIDLDRFKALNDTLGHDYGDLLLIEVGERIKSCVREVDTVARFAGDEFVIVLEVAGTEMDDASQNIAHVAERIRASLAAPYSLKEHTHHGSSSIGVCLFKNHEKSVDELIKCADIAMYQAKNSGRNKVRFFDHFIQ